MSSSCVLNCICHSKGETWSLERSGHTNRCEDKTVCRSLSHHSHYYSHSSRICVSQKARAKKRRRWGEITDATATGSRSFNLSVSVFPTSALILFIWSANYSDQLLLANKGQLAPTVWDTSQKLGPHLFPDGLMNLLLIMCQGSNVFAKMPKNNFLNL